MIVVSYDLYAEAWRALRGIERRPWSGCLWGRRSEMLPVMSAHIRIHIKFSPAIRERTFECCMRETHGGTGVSYWVGRDRKMKALTLVACVCVHMDGQTAGTVEALCAVRTGVSSSGVRLLVSGDRRQTFVWAEVTLRRRVRSWTLIFRNSRRGRRRTRQQRRRTDGMETWRFLWVLERGNRRSVRLVGHSGRGGGGGGGVY